MARNQEVAVVVLDVGPHMHAHLDAAGRGLATLGLAKAAARPHHELALVLFGATETANALADECAAAGHAGQYAHVAVPLPLSDKAEAPVDSAAVAALRAPAPGGGAADFVDALAVALDLLVKVRSHRIY
jgi:hypothetical protein